MNLKTPETQAPQSSLDTMHPLTEQELNAIVGGLRITAPHLMGKKWG